MPSPGLYLYTSNRLEVLADALAEVLAEAPASPFDPEWIVVQSKGMERWVSLQLARRQGVCANCLFPYPNHFVREVFRRVLPDFPECSIFDPKYMTWQIMRLLPDQSRGPGFESVRHYLGENRDKLKLFQLAGRIADTFDQYLLFRPEMILRWERGEEENWQAALWRELVRERGAVHRAALGKLFFETLRDKSADIEDLPGRVAVFGISALPRFHVQILAALARFCRINLFLMNPCREYWGDIVSEWDISRTVSRESTEVREPAELYLHKGNSLLASMGKLGRDFFDLVNDFQCIEKPRFFPPGEETLLTCIQNDILHLRERGERDDGRKTSAGDDDSIQVHACHSPMREMEVLQNQLLHFFEQRPDLQPKDILVMAPDIETYAPFIRAVFDLPSDDPRRIPFSIADRSLINESRIIQIFMAVLDLHGSRFSVPQVMAVLESPAVRSRFDLSEQDLELIRRWVGESGIRWGVNQQDRGRAGLPEFPENTWEAGLKRLLLGYAMVGGGERMFAGILPYDRIEGSDSQVLGRFGEFVNLLFETVSGLGQPRTLQAWSLSLTRMLEAFFRADENTALELELLRRILLRMGEIQGETGFGEELEIRVIKRYLEYSLEKEGLGFGFMTGGVTFCALLPMRSIPFKVICLLGMQHDAYPREHRAVGFDLMAKHPAPGDRSRRNDDRYLFLEALLSARETLYISYVGQDIEDNSPVPPSVLVSELLDYVEQGFELPGGDIRDHIVTRHRLQGFSPAYFEANTKLQNYSAEHFAAAQSLIKPRRAPANFIAGGLSEPDAEWRILDLEDLCAFLAHPTRFLLKRRLGLELEENWVRLEEKEPFDLRGLEKYRLARELLDKRLAGDDLRKFLRAAGSAGRLPPGTVGECLCGRMLQEIEFFAQKTLPLMRDGPLEPLEVDLNIGGFRLQGRLRGIYPQSLLRYRYAGVKARDRLRIWVHHLALQAAGTKEYPHASTLVGLDPAKREENVWAAWEYEPAENSRRILEELLHFYWQGLHAPLPLFEQSSWEYAQARLQKKVDEDKALQRALRTWQGGEYASGEGDDEYYRLCFKHPDSLDAEFRQIALKIFGPLMAKERRRAK
jgi:exodeoxyribonuclease V gamma subunit